jgi:predicted methyltransferase
MLRTRLFGLSLSSLVVASFVAGCAEDPPPAPVPPPPPPAIEAPPPPPLYVPPPPEPTAEEKKKAKEAKELSEDRAKWEAESKTELARWTPEMHKAATALADKTFWSGKAAIEAALKGTYRTPADVARDKYRHPVATLDFFGFKPTMTVIDIGPGEGYYTELLAPVLAKKGHYIATQGGDPNGPAEKRSTFYAQEYKGFLDKAPELYGKVETVIVDGKAPSLGKDGSVDMVLAMRELHGMENNGTMDKWVAEVFRALKPGGVFGVEEHRAPADADPVASAKKGYLPEKWVIDQVEAAGFKLAGKSEINANPKDTKDYSEGVWALPPSFKNGEKDHDKYAAIGESDRMTLKFVKPGAKPAAAAPKAAGAAPKPGPKPAAK